MFNLLILILIFLFKFGNCERCDNRECNNHGVCAIQTEISNKSICNCVPNVYIGEKCEIWSKLCDRKYCGDNQCVDYPGGYQCICSTGLGGQNCSSKLISPTYLNPIVLYNTLSELDRSEIILIFFSILPTIALRLEMYCTGNMMSVDMIYVSNENTHIFSDTDNIKKTAATYNIHDVGNIPEVSGKFAAFQYLVTQTSSYYYHLTITDVETENLLYDWQFIVLSKGLLLSFNVALLVPSLVLYVFNNNLL